MLRAPVDGSVLELHAVPGELASPEESLATVGNNGAVWVWADLYERDIAKVMNARASGDLTAAVFVEAYPGESFPGKVDLISPSMDRSSRTVKTRVAVDNADGRLLAGMFAKVQVFLPGEARALAPVGVGAQLPDREGRQEGDGQRQEEPRAFDGFQHGYPLSSETASAAALPNRPRTT